ncbi:MAG: DUF4276 family protein [Deltaproteobacteria bacterium]|nr:DUF4276 family protein [Deltaproteobacteria bacterium]
MTKTLVFLVEEESAEQMLSVIMPRLLEATGNADNVAYQILPFEGKSDLEKKLCRRLRGWRKPVTRFVIIRDQDSGDCRMIKEKLLQLCQEAGKSDCLVRIACHELESFYLGDLAAVEAGLSLNGLSQRQRQKKYRAPDSVASPSQELIRITGKRYQKVAGSRAISRHLDLENNKSHSFNVLVDGIRRLIEDK